MACWSGGCLACRNTSSRKQLKKENSRVENWQRTLPFMRSPAFPQQQRIGRVEAERQPSGPGGGPIQLHACIHGTPLGCVLPHHTTHRCFSPSPQKKDGWRQKENCINKRWLVTSSCEHATLLNCFPLPPQKKDGWKQKENLVDRVVALYRQKAIKPPM